MDDDAFGCIFVLGLIAGAIYLAYIVAIHTGVFLYYALVFVGANVMAAADKIFCGWNAFGLMFAWAIGGLFIGTVSHFAVKETRRLNRPSVKPFVFVLLFGTLGASFVAHINTGVPPSSPDASSTGARPALTQTSPSRRSAEKKSQVAQKTDLNRSLPSEQIRQATPPSNATTYRARLSVGDHKNRSGRYLNSIPNIKPNDILLQDRMNFHKYNGTDAGDEDDGLFHKTRTDDYRAIFEDKPLVTIPPGREGLILSNTPLVEVMIGSGRITVRILDEGGSVSTNSRETRRLR